MVSQLRMGVRINLEFIGDKALTAGSDGDYGGAVYNTIDPLS